MRYYIFNFAWDAAKWERPRVRVFWDGIILEVDSASRCMYKKYNDEIVQLRGVPVHAKFRAVSWKFPNAFFERFHDDVSNNTIFYEAFGTGVCITLVYLFFLGAETADYHTR